MMMCEMKQPFSMLIRKKHLGVIVEKNMETISPVQSRSKTKSKRSNVVPVQCFWWIPYF